MLRAPTPRDKTKTATNAKRVAPKITVFLPALSKDQVCAKVFDGNHLIIG